MNSTAVKTDRTRLDYLDIEKGFAILFVLMVHCLPPEGSMPFWAKLFCSFAMPLFFMACGVTSRPLDEYSWKSFWEYLKQNAFALMLPYFIWCLIYMPFCLESFGRMLYGSTQMLIAGGGGNVQLWYLPCFFLAKVAMYGVFYIESKVKKFRHLVLILLTAASFAIGFLLPKLPNGYPWCLDIAFVALGFMIGLHGVADFVNSLDQKSALIQIPFIVVSGVIVYVGNAFGDPSTNFVDMCTSNYGNIFWFLVNAGFGIIFFRALSSLISKINLSSGFAWIRKAFSWLGRNTMRIFALHMPFNTLYIVPWMTKTFNLDATKIGHALIIALVVLAFTILCSLVINAIIPQLLGKRKTN